MSGNLGSIGLQASAADVRSAGTLQTALSILWRRSFLIAAAAAVACALGVVVVSSMPERYSAAAYVRGVVPGSNAMAKDDNDNPGATIGLDLGRVLETQTRLLSSYQLAHRVIEQIGLIELRPELNEAPLPLIDIFSQSENAAEHKDDKAVAAVLRNLAVTSDPRAYLITVRYSDRDPQLAAVIADAFVAEFLRSVKLQALAQQRATAQGALAKQLATFGPKHPKVGEAKARLASLDDLITDELNKTPKTILQAAGENVTAAIASPANAKTPLVLAVFLVMGLGIGIAIAFWLERDQLSTLLSRYYAEQVRIAD
jgi:uncharacterized protein involved in exopolysaccharide biosynthesis